MDEGNITRDKVRAEYYQKPERATPEQLEIVRSLGFTHVGQILELPASEKMSRKQLMVELDKIPHLIRIIE
jgi:hypothetical protein